MSGMTVKDCPTCERPLTIEVLTFTRRVCRAAGCSNPYMKEGPHILEQDGVVRIHESVLKDLLEYSTSMPTGVYAGKRWKRRWRDGEKKGWTLGEYIDDGAEDGTLLTRWTPIEVIPWDKAQVSK